MLCLSLFTAALTSSQALLAEPQHPPCISSHAALQDAIDALPQSPPTAAATSPSVKLWLCPGAPIAIPEAIQIVHRSVQIGCASSDDNNINNSHDNSSTEPPRCTLTAQQGVETRLVQVKGGISEHGQATNTVEFHGILLEGGQVYNDSSSNSAGGAAIHSVGANVVIVECDFADNTSFQGGGALTIEDGDRPILVLLQDNRFRDNGSLEGSGTSAATVEEDACHSAYLHQQHAATTAILSFEEHLSNTERMNRRNLLEQWDDPVQAYRALEVYQPHAGATLCF